MDGWHVGKRRQNRYQTRGPIVVERLYPNLRTWSECQHGVCLEVALVTGVAWAHILYAALFVGNYYVHLRQSLNSKPSLSEEWRRPICSFTHTACLLSSTAASYTPLSSSPFFFLLFLFSVFNFSYLSTIVCSEVTGTSEFHWNDESHCSNDGPFVLQVGVCVCVCVCEREWVREGRVRDREDTETDKDTERDKDRERQIDIIWEGEETADT